MKKIALLAIFLFVLAACSANNPPAQESTQNDAQAVADAQEKTQETPLAENESSQEVANTVSIDGNTITVKDDGTGEDANESGMKKTVNITTRGIDYSTNLGPIIFSVNSLQLSNIIVENEDVAPMLGLSEGDACALLSIDVTTESTTDDTVNFYPDQSTIVTSTKEQVTCEWLLSDDVGGELLGQVVKNGQIFFICKNSNAEDIENIRWIIDGPFDDNFDQVGDDLEIIINFER